MDGGFSTIAIVILAFLLAGFVKGVVGLGLPTVVVGLLSLTMTPAQAAALLVIPSLVTNVWQSAAGPRLWALLQRLWPMLLAICVGIGLGASMFTVNGGSLTLTALGVVLALYAVFGLTAPQFSVPARAEPWLSPAIGALTGMITAVTGIFVIPAVPYLQALGISFSVSTVALGAVLAREGILQTSVAGASLLALAPALVGMWLGQLVRARVRPAVFRFCFFLGLLTLGAHLALRGLI